MRSAAAPRAPAPNGVRLLIRMAVAAAVLAAVHVGLAAIWPSVTDWELGHNLNLTWYAANLFLLGSLLLRGPLPGPAIVAGHAAGYAAMVWLVWPFVQVLNQNLLLLVLTTILYAGLLPHPYLLGYLFLFLGSQRFLPAYLYPSFLLLSLLYTTLPPFLKSIREQRQWFVPACHVAGLLLLTALLLPILFYLMQGTAQSVQREVHDPAVQAALRVSLTTSAIATLVVLLLGVPLAYAIVRVPFPGRSLIDTLIDLPIVVPAPIAGITLLSFTGPKSPLGMYLEGKWGVRLFDTQAAIVIAQVFVSSPFLVRAAMIAFAAVDVRFENVGRTLGASSVSAFVRITLPLALPGILIGTMLAWFRAMAEFGALRIMANRPQTMPILAFERFVGYGQSEAHSIGMLVLLTCLCVIAGMWVVRAMPVLIRRTMGAIDASR